MNIFENKDMFQTSDGKKLMLMSVRWLNYLIDVETGDVCYGGVTLGELEDLLEENNIQRINK